MLQSDFARYGDRSGKACDKSGPTQSVVPRKELITWPAACDAGGQQREKPPLRATEPEMSLGGDRQRGPEE